jgi:hypothetical protein
MVFQEVEWENTYDRLWTEALEDYGLEHNYRVTGVDGGQVNRRVEAHHIFERNIDSWVDRVIGFFAPWKVCDVVAEITGEPGEAWEEHKEHPAMPTGTDYNGWGATSANKLSYDGLHVAVKDESLRDSIQTAAAEVGERYGVEHGVT